VAPVKGGRKFWVTLLGMGLCAWRPESASAVAAIVLTFNGANAAVSWAYAKTDSTARVLTGTTDIERRRDDALGIEPAP
jgi:hypothetical protein